MKNVAPSVLISVAVITAVSTLLAAAISGYFISRNARRSLTHAAEMADLDRAAEKAAQHRAARREAYAAFATAALGSLGDIMAAKAKSMGAADRASLLGKAQTSVNTVIVARGVLEVEGPKDVAEHGAQVGYNLHDALRAVRRYAKDDDGTSVISTQDGDEIDKFYDPADSAIQEFVKVARKTLKAM